MNASTFPRTLASVSSRTLVALEHRLHDAGREATKYARWVPSWYGDLLADEIERNREDFQRTLGSIPRLPSITLARYRGLTRRGRVAVWAIALLFLGAWEAQTSSIQSRLLSAFASTLTYSVEKGASSRIVFPRSGPWDERRGYTQLQDFSKRLDKKGYRVASQAKFSPSLAFAARTGVTPPQLGPSEVGLVIRGEGGDTLYNAVRDRAYFRSFDEIPPVVVKSLLYIENRELANEDHRTANPAVDWTRFCKATMLYVGRHLGLPLPSEGGSTLAVQLEKYRHSPEGKTDSAPEKLRQMLAASIRAYRRGPNTTAAKRQIVLDYVNSVPLGGMPGYGEISGLNEGLQVWFNLEPANVRRALLDPKHPNHEKALTATLALLCAVRAPTFYLTRNNGALKQRVASYTRMLTTAGVLDLETAREVRTRPIRVRRTPAKAIANSIQVDQGTGRVREELRELLGVKDNYALDRLHVEVESTLHPALQRDVSKFFRGLTVADTVLLRGLTGERLLDPRNAEGVVYSLLVCERTPEGNVVRVEEDNAPGVLDLNRSTMLELGSTAKLRTLTHYLDIVSRERATFVGRDRDDVLELAESARDPITRWVGMQMVGDSDLPVDTLLARALDREYSANPWETFYTGGGLTTFSNFKPEEEDTKRFSVREASVRSNNLVFIRLMRDMIAYHAARLPYDAWGILSGVEKRDREDMLREIAVSEGEAPDTAWIMRTKLRRAQDMRLRSRIERDAFERMATDWKRLGFPFAHLVPSYATAIGSSADQPGALADLMALIMNDGRPRSTFRIRRIKFGAGTPYETTYEAPEGRSAAPVIEPAVARAVRGVLADVVEHGSARRIRGAFIASRDSSVTLTIGGKTGTGDNRIERYGRGGRLISSRAVSRTATFVFYLQDRYYGVITATVLGPSAESYHFTSALPVAILRDLAPSLERELKIEGTPLSPEALATVTEAARVRREAAAAAAVAVPAEASPSEPMIDRLGY